ncbi:DUF3325 domain-containing protein [Hydrogenophaga sp.]|uniref:DUF3325 domain-containing protein n=1 Tax=Hydrogenophaga sp. TaxID=1904254 RepID=UPI0025BB579B|nr:DUF3325 domain-containing protein [Hydrogenophaga sp.]MBT9463951.1 DUF3325 domain-containing protein [Hydrogenophaga sp.]
MSEAMLLGLAALAAWVSMAWLALSMEVHWRQVTGSQATVPRLLRRGLRQAGALGLLASLALCLAADHPSMAVLVWVMFVAASAFGIAMLLTWRPRVMRALLVGARV